MIITPTTRSAPCFQAGGKRPPAKGLACRERSLVKMTCITPDVPTSRRDLLTIPNLAGLTALLGEAS
jgi:hypothetical protein